MKDKRLSLDDTPIGECSLHFMEASRCELITGAQSERPPLKGRLNEALASRRRREGQRQCDGPSAAPPPPPLRVSMFNLRHNYTHQAKQLHQGLIRDNQCFQAAARRLPPAVRGHSAINAGEEEEEEENMVVS